MKKSVKIYDLHDPQQYEDEREYWRNKTPEEKLHALEVIRSTWHKLDEKQDGNPQRLLPTAVGIRIIEPE